MDICYIIIIFLIIYIYLKQQDIRPQRVLCDIDMKKVCKGMSNNVFMEKKREEEDEDELKKQQLIINEQIMNNEDDLSDITDLYYNKFEEDEDGDERIANRALYNGQMNERAKINRTRFSVDSIRKFWEPELREEESRIWWGNNDYLDNLM